MNNENLRQVCEHVGLRNVGTVISSGNIVFDATSDDPAEIEATLESAWPVELGFESTTIVRSRDDLETLVSMRPFGDLEHGRETYLLVTFSKHPLVASFDLPYEPTREAFRAIAATDRELFTVSDTTAVKTPDVMSWVEQQLGKTVSSRTWLTVTRILRKMV